LSWKLAVTVGTMLVCFMLASFSVHVSLARLEGFNFAGGRSLSPELTALVARFVRRGAIDATQDVVRQTAQLRTMIQQFLKQVAGT